MSLKNVKNILFDLGGVIYDIDPMRTQKAIRALLPHENAVEIYSKTQQIEAISLYETGKMDTPTFIAALRAELNLSATDKEIADAWNALLVGLVDGRIQQLELLRPNYNLALLSNTNDLHYTEIWNDCEPVYAQMQRCFFSFKMGMRKPNTDIYETVLAEMGWNREETIFVEDSPPNLEGARSIGLPVFPIHQLTDFEVLVERLK